MNAVTFFKSMGLKAVKQYLENDNIRTKEMHNELKQIVEAFELVEVYGSVDEAKDYLDNLRLDSKIELKDAIELVEQCQ